MKTKVERVKRKRKAKQYLVVLRANSSVRVAENRGERIEVMFNPSNEKVRCCFMDIYEKDEHGTDLYKELQSEVKVSADSINEAIEKAGGVSDAFLTYACLSAAAAISPLGVHLAYDNTPDVENREFIQYFYNLKLPAKATRKLDYEKFKEITTRLEKSEHQDRIGRAMRWYRKSLLELDYLDKFANFWFGLECLNPIIMKKFGIPPHKIQCPNCKQEFERSGTEGIEYVFTETLENGKEIYRRARDTRHGLIHGFKNLKKLQSAAKALAPSLEKALCTAVLLILDTPKAERTEWVRKGFSHVSPVYMKAKVILHETDREKLKQEGQYPHFKDEHILLSSSMKKDGETKLRVGSTLKPSFACPYTPESMEIFGPEEGYQAKFEKA